MEMTGLSPRVIRVWFQNKRCKDKKKTIQMKLQMQQEKVMVIVALELECVSISVYVSCLQEGRKLGYGMQGIPMVASSPVRHDSPLNLHGLEVTAYQPPWKALSDFALHADLDNTGNINTHTPAFQHLVNQVRQRIDQEASKYCTNNELLINSSLQMHGYDSGQMNQMPSHGPPPPQMAGNPMMDPTAHHHPDSTDSYVTYLESDDSMQGSP